MLIEPAAEQNQSEMKNKSMKLLERDERINIELL